MMNKRFSNAAFIVLFALVLQNCGHKKHHHADRPELPVTLPLVKDTFTYKKYVAIIQAIRHIELRALEKGYIESIAVDEGQWVNQGQLLFKIIPWIYQAEYFKAKAEMQFAEIEYQNTKALADSQVVSKNELALARAKYEKAKAEMELAAAHLKFTEIRAPFSGMIGRFHETRIGALVDEGELLTTLTDNSKIWVYFNVPEYEYLNYMKNGGIPTTVELEMANFETFPFKGKVETIEADFNQETGNIAFRATFDNPDKILRHGETGNILVRKDFKDALIIPQISTFEVLEKRFVYKVENGVLKAVPVKIKAELPHIFIVESGLTAKDTILLEGLNRVHNEETIIPVFKKPQSVYNHLDLYAE